MKHVGAVVVVIGLWGGAASADDEQATRSPGFVTLLRQDATPRAGGDLTYFFLDNASDVTLFRLDLHGHYVDRSSGLGGYLQLPIASVRENGDSTTVVGNAELGGIFIPKLAAPDFGLVLRAGLTLPTGPDDSNANAAIVTIATLLRPVDLYTALPQTSTVRLSASPIARSGNFFARIDLGLDVNVYANGQDTMDPALIVDIGMGFDLGSIAVMGEASTLRITQGDGETVAAGALSVRGNLGNVQPYGALLIPLDNDTRSEFDLGLLAGLEGKL